MRHIYNLLRRRLLFPTFARSVQISPPWRTPLGVSGAPQTSAGWQGPFHERGWISYLTESHWVRFDNRLDRYGYLEGGRKDCLNHAGWETPKLHVPRIWGPALHATGGRILTSLSRWQKSVVFVGPLVEHCCTTIALPPDLSQYLERLYLHCSLRRYVGL